MASVIDPFLRTQLEERRKWLETAISSFPGDAAMAELLTEVDSALERMEGGSYGICEACHENIEKDRLIVDPLVRFCLDHLNSAEQRALEQDLQLAAQIQRALLPPTDVHAKGWRIHYHYQPAGLVSGDYCDVIQPASGDGDLIFLLGDVSGKGVAASMLMSHLHAMFRSLAAVGLPLDQMMAHANRVFCESTLAGQYATLVCGRAGTDGVIRLASAGHCPPLLLGDGGTKAIEATGLPLGMFRSGDFAVCDYKLKPGQGLFLYTDGLSETRSPSATEYGLEGLEKFLARRNGLPPEELAAACLADLREFRGSSALADDLTIMVIHREE